MSIFSNVSEETVQRFEQFAKFLEQFVERIEQLEVEGE